MAVLSFPDVEADAIASMTAEQLFSTSTFEMIVSKEDKFEQDKTMNLCLFRCKEIGVNQKNFQNLLKEYKIKLANLRGVSKGNKTKFIDQPIELNCGDWICDISGIKKNQMNASNGNIECKFASPIPVVVTELLRNVDENTEKIKLAFFKEGWKTLLCNRSMVASNTKIIDLADRGLEVNSDNAKLLVRYIADLVALNLDVIPRYDAISHFGWVNGGFMPYCDNYKFDGELKYKAISDSLHACGDFDKWVEYTHELRKNKYLRLQMAASFASPIVSKVNALPFILHYWGGSGNGKTVGMMVAASVWGDPHKGKMWRSLDNTVNNVTELSAVLHDIPCCLDELQTIKKFSCSYDLLIMKLTEGINRGRMNYDRIELVKTWNCAYIFTGEEPLTKDNSGGGAKNRVIEFETTKKIVENGNAILEFIYQNYGFAGEKFVNAIADEDLQGQYSEILNELLEHDTTEKQAMAMACILLGDKMACRYIYTNETPMSVDDVAEFLKTNREVDITERAYDWVLNFIAINNNKFQSNEFNECWGKIDDEYIYINKNVLTSQMSANGFEFDAVKTVWAKKGYLVKNSQGRLVHNASCHGIKGTYIKLLQKPAENNEIPEEVPF